MRIEDTPPPPPIRGGPILLGPTGSPVAVTELVLARAIAEHPRITAIEHAGRRHTTILGAVVAAALLLIVIIGWVVNHHTRARIDQLQAQQTAADSDHRATVCALDDLILLAATPTARTAYPAGPTVYDTTLTVIRKDSTYRHCH